jgi:di- and tripeptidase
MSTSRSQHSCIASSPSLSSDAHSRANSNNSGDSDIESIIGSDTTLPQTCEQIKKQLMSRWRYPTLTVHKIDVPIDNPTIISHYATAAVSMRIVPNQDITDICDTFKHYVCQIFQKLKSDNQISVSIHLTSL